MIEKNVWFVSAAVHCIDAEVARDEPSHIHIPRPAGLRRHTPAPRLEPTGELGDLAPTDGAVQAA